MTRTIIMAEFPHLEAGGFESPFSAWIHMDRPIDEKDRDYVRDMVERGCLYFFLSGDNGAYFEEVVDEVVEDFSKNLVLTSSSNQSLGERASEFFSIKNIKGEKIETRLIIALENDVQKNKIIDEMIECLRAEGLYNRSFELR